MNRAAIDPPHSSERPPGGIREAWTQQIPQPIQLRDMTFVSVGVTFAPSVIAAHLPANLTPCEDCSGGFFVGLAREGHAIAPFGTGHVWFDLQGHDGSSGPGRYLARLVSSSARAGDPTAGRVQPGQSRITESPGRTLAEVDGAEGPAFRVAVSQGRLWTSSAGIDHAIAPCGFDLAATRLIITPWAADWCDVEPSEVVVLSDEWADLAPLSLTWGAIGRSAAMTLGISAPLAPPKRT
jgi:hypothetical protein